MDFEFTVEQKDIQKACNQRFIAIHFPEKYGGQGLGLLEDVIITEEFFRADSTLGGAIVHVKLGSEFMGEQMKSKKYGC